MVGSNFFKSLKELLPKGFFPLSPWDVKKGVGSFITFEFGERLTIKKNNESIERGSIHLWIYLCDWEIFNLNKSILCSDNLSDATSDLIKIFIGKRLMDIKVDNISRIIDFVFESELCVKLFFTQAYEEDDEMFILYVGKDVYSYSPATGFAHE